MLFSLVCCLSAVSYFWRHEKITLMIINTSGTVEKTVSARKNDKQKRMETKEMEKRNKTTMFRRDPMNT